MLDGVQIVAGLRGRLGVDGRTINWSQDRGTRDQSHNQNGLSDFHDGFHRTPGGKKTPHNSESLPF
jgi:hypothetical protein